MSAASEGIWFPIADNHHLHNPIIDQPADIIQATINPQTIPGKSGANRKPPIRFPNDHRPHNPINDQTAHGIQPTINPWESSSLNRRTSIQSDLGPRLDLRPRQTWWRDTQNGHRVRSGWSCNLVIFLFSQLLGPRSAVISRMKDEVQRVYSTLLTRVHRKPRTASADELPVLIGVMDLPVHKHNKASGPMVLCNGGLHVHALLLMPPTSRLKGSLADHFLEKRDLYVGPGKPTVRIDVRPVVEDHAQASRIALTGFSPTSVSAMAALIRSAAMSAISL
jgi:hypothetical protein